MKAVGLQPEPGKAHPPLQAALEIGHADLAIKELKVALEKDPTTASAESVRLVLYSSTGLRKQYASERLRASYRDRPRSPKNKIQ